MLRERTHRRGRRRRSCSSSWRDWATAAEEWVGSSKQFAQKLEDRKLRFQKQNDGERGWWGLQLRLRPQADKIKLVVSVVGETPGGGMKVEVGRERREVRLPKSKVLVKDLGNGTSEITVPGWLAKKENLSASEEAPPF